MNSSQKLNPHTLNQHMNQETKFHLALIQIENLSQLVKDNEYEHFFVSHLIPIKVELQRQLSCIKNE
jgi:hypothetical protein